MPTLDDIERLAKAATPGKRRWGVEGQTQNGVPESMFKLYAGTERALPVIVLQPEACWTVLADDTEFIAACDRETILALVRVAQAAQAHEAAMHRSAREAAIGTMRQLLSALAALEQTP
jgi:hypothetical protein